MLRGKRFQLVTLGRLTLIGGDGDEDAALAKRRFKLALLAVLAMARRPVPRDTLVEMFWGDQEESRARHSLSNALSSLRRALGQGAITTRDADVAIAAEVPLDVDALDLARAIENRDFARAAEVYGGPFLNGVYIGESPAFDQWLSGERRRLEALFVQACAPQCATLARTRRWKECRALAARWIEAEPLSSDAAIYLLNAIKAPGTRPALADALEEFERLRSQIAREFELQPDPVVRDLAERIREQMGSAPDPEPIVAVEVPPVEPVLVAAMVERSPALVVAPPNGPRRWAPNRWLGAGIAAVIAFGAFAVAMANRPPERTTRKPVIAMLAIDTRADSTVAWLADGLPRMVAGKLARYAAVDVVAPAQVEAVLVRSGHPAHTPVADAAARDLARRVGATLVVRGAIGRDGANVVLDLTVHDVDTGALLHSAVLARNDALALADEAAVRILGAANVGAPGTQIATLETSSLEAYQHFMRATEAGQAGRLGELKHELDEAIALDSGFIAAIRSRISAAIGDNDMTLVSRLRATMRRHAHRATEFDRMAEEATDAYYAGERDRSEALARALVRRYPRDPRGYQLLESVLDSHGSFEEAGQIAIQTVALDSLAMEAGSGPCAPCRGLFSVIGYHWLRADFEGAATWARRWIRTQPDAPAAWAALAWTYSYMQRPDSAIALMQRARSLSGGELWAHDELARMLLIARRHDAADSVIALMEKNPKPEWREASFDLRATFERERGRFRAANRVLDQMVAAVPTTSNFADMVRADNQRSLGDFAGAERRFEAPAHPRGEVPTLPRPATGARAFCWHHALAADAYSPAGDTLRLRAAADTLEAGCGKSYYGRDWRLYHHVRGLIALRAGRYAEAERELAQARWTPVEGWSRTTVELAKAQNALTRPHDAIATLRTAYATRLDAMGRYVPISQLDFWMAQMFAHAGERDSAQVYAGYVQRAWRDADPEIRELLAQLK
jgi:DNA-binding SARP family transcriptional activator/tetratricopeptide (TPR) repeat protein